MRGLRRLPPCGSSERRRARAKADLMSIRRLHVDLSANSLWLLLSFAMMAAGPLALADAEDWPQWRGPRGDGTCAEIRLPTHWGASAPGGASTGVRENIAWSVAIPGKGHSSPIVVGD